MRRVVHDRERRAREADLAGRDTRRRPIDTGQRQGVDLVQTEASSEGSAGMKKDLLKVGDEVAIGPSYRGARLSRGRIQDLRSWIRVYDSEQGNTIDILRENFVKSRHGSSKWGVGVVPQSGIHVQMYEDGEWHEPKVVFSRDVQRFWSEEEDRQALIRETERIRRERTAQMKEWLRWLEIPYDEHAWGYDLDKEVRVSYEEIEKLHDRFQEARLSG
jgi:hypothetical protein